jgi:hypothetical protein
LVADERAGPHLDRSAAWADVGAELIDG